jgi:hypothetical protein
LYPPFLSQVAKDTVVKGNKITGTIVGGNNNLGGAGLVVNDDFPIPFWAAMPATGNRMKDNKVNSSDFGLYVGATRQGTWSKIIVAIHLFPQTYAQQESNKEHVQILPPDNEQVQFT